MKKLSTLTKKQIISTAVIGLALIALIVFGVYNMTKANTTTTDGELLYLEETVELGDIIVGVSESATASLITSTIEVEAGMEVEEVLVSAGQFVTEGEVIAIVNLDDYVESENEDEQALEDAQTALELLEIETESKLIEAQKTYDLNIAEGSNASAVYTLTIADIEDALTEIDDELEEINDEIDDVKDQISNGLTDDMGVSDAEDDVADQEATITSLEKQITTAQTEMDANTDATEEEQAAAQAEISSLEDQLTQAESQLEVLEAALEKAEEDYDTAYDALSDQLTSLKAQRTSLNTQRENYVISMDSLEIEADSTYEVSIADYNSAQTIYDNTVAELEDALEEAQDLVDELIEALEEEDDDDETLIIDDQGNVLAPFTGYIMSVDEIDGGDEIPPLMITLADSSCAELSVSITQDDIADVEVGMDVNVIFDAYEGVYLSAYVESIEITTTSGISASVSYTVTIYCEVPETTDDGSTMAIFQGMTATSTFILKQENDVLVISSKCITTEDGIEYVTVLHDDGTLETIEITTGFSDGFDVEVTSGLEEGDVVIIESAVSASAY